MRHDKHEVVGWSTTAWVAEGAPIDIDGLQPSVCRDRNGKLDLIERCAVCSEQST